MEFNEAAVKRIIKAVLAEELKFSGNTLPIFKSYERPAPDIWATKVCQPVSSIGPSSSGTVTVGSLIGGTQSFTGGDTLTAYNLSTTLTCDATTTCYLSKIDNTWVVAPIC
jgi:hypothetical protein